MVDLSLLLPIAALRPEQAVPFANLVRYTGYERLWQGQTPVIGNYQVAAWLAGLGIRVPTGFGVNVMPLTTPYQAAHETRSLALATGQSVSASFGPGYPALQKRVTGKSYASPLTATREFVQAVRGLVRGESVEQPEAEYFPITAGLPAVPCPPIRIGIGVLRPKMARLAGEIADEAVMWMCPPDYLRDVLVPAVKDGAKDRGRPPRITAMIPCALAADGRDPVQLALGTCGLHMSAAHYQDALRHAGHTVTGSEDDVQKITDAGLFLYGTPRDIHDGIARFADAGVDEVVLNMVGVAGADGIRKTAADLERIISTV
ncbi:LLM class flavin-dependent oxidoreductase [Streptomyces sp. NPDC002589]|uniref:LLM class flavin-dependent oxidoreductase n=1 Tax=Streptomyces sp. NPDC002589 TaxID=3154420 RepID=UPI003332598C